MTLADLHDKWRQDYPGESHALLALRDNLVRAEHHRNRIQAVFENLERDLSETYLPMRYWDRRTRGHYLFFEKLYSRTQREFIKALKLLHNFQTAVQTKAAALAKRQPPPPPELVPGEKCHSFVQLADITVVDGKIVTQVEYDANYWLTGNTREIAWRYERHLIFHDGVIPEPYKWVLTHDGVTYPYTDAFFIGYSPEEFLRLCQLEIDTGSEYLLDGDRVLYERLPTL